MKLANSKEEEIKTVFIHTSLSHQVTRINCLNSKKNLIHIKGSKEFLPEGSITNLIKISQAYRQIRKILIRARTYNVAQK